MRTLIISSRSQWENSLNQLENWLVEFHIHPTIQQHIYVSFDEIVSNIFRHNSTQKTIKINIKIDLETSFIALTFSDNCPLFNPLNKIDKVEISLGGWGIDIVKKLMDEIHYEIVNDKNCLSIKKYIV
ncbi:MAG TPA: ATP-binding protein [Chitinophagales bacterium]|nr:ATP-binding protein [Chitinophagales bacterium]